MKPYLKLYMNPPNLPRHWAATKDQSITVKRSDTRDDLGRNVYTVHQQSSRGEMSTYIIQERWIQCFLQRLCEATGASTARISTDRDIWRWATSEAEKARRAA